MYAKLVPEIVSRLSRELKAEALLNILLKVVTPEVSQFRGWLNAADPSNVLFKVVTLETSQSVKGLSKSSASLKVFSRLVTFCILQLEKFPLTIEAPLKVSFNVVVDIAGSSIAVRL